MIAPRWTRSGRAHGMRADGFTAEAHDLHEVHTMEEKTDCHHDGAVVVADLISEGIPH